eukprot:TRINITY_DN11203_c1_g1_i1.p1 TRINITY_DN11203_c1_g1~~TRINITY_DN11203_c1_g1_i1.p1  ORF type:complete len:404 (+),score=24.38 TRINITY_DN11203_c1_g1_i1:78-1289(+)
MYGIQVRFVRFAWEPYFPRNGVWLGLRIEELRQPPRWLAFLVLGVLVCAISLELSSRFASESALFMMLFGLTLYSSLWLFALVMLVADIQIRFNCFIAFYTLNFLLALVVDATSVRSTPSTPADLFKFACFTITVCTSAAFHQGLLFHCVSFVMSLFPLIGAFAHVARYVYLQRGIQKSFFTDPGGVPLFFSTFLGLLGPSILWFIRLIEQRRYRSRYPQDTVAAKVWATQEDIESASLHSIDIVFASEDELPAFNEYQLKHRAEFLEWPGYDDALSILSGLSRGNNVNTKAFFYERFLRWKNDVMRRTLPCGRVLLKERDARFERMLRYMRRQDRQIDLMTSFCVFRFYHGREKIADGRLPSGFVMDLMDYVVELGDEDCCEAPQGDEDCCTRPADSRKVSL